MTQKINLANLTPEFSLMIKGWVILKGDMVISANSFYQSNSSDNLIKIEKNTAMLCVSSSIYNKAECEEIQILHPEYGIISTDPGNVILLSRKKIRLRNFREVIFYVIAAILTCITITYISFVCTSNLYKMSYNEKSDEAASLLRSLILSARNQILGGV